jgi:hypothetical protein
MKYVMIILVILLMTGCAASPERQAKDAEFRRTIPTCIEDIDCKAKWEAAQIWVVKHSGFKLQIVTDVLIETYNSTQHSPELAIRVVKEPVGSETYRIVVLATCANIFGCIPDAMEAVLNFNNTIAAIQP